MKYLRFTIVFFILCGYIFPANGVEVRQNIPLTQWRFLKFHLRSAHLRDFDDSQWESVRVPHTWNTDFIKLTGYYKGPAWYRTSLPVSDQMKGKRLFIRFEGALTTADVFLNGEKLGRHEGGYSAFIFEITDRIKWDSTNIIAVMVNNLENSTILPVNDQLFPRYGGIYRPVSLLVTDKICISPLDYASPGVYIQQEKVSQQFAKLNILTKISNASNINEKITVNTLIFDRIGKQVESYISNIGLLVGNDTSVVQIITIDNPHLWSARKDPYLYSVTVQVKQGDKIIDQITQPLGLRYFHVDSQKGFFLNGQHYDLYGVARHQDWEKEATALSYEQHKYDIDLIKEMGARIVRLVHYQHADVVYSLCDSSGIVVWTEIPLANKYPYDTNPTLIDNAKQQLTELIRQSYNHPSIIFWGLYNEAYVPEDHVRQLYNLAKSEDPFRLVTAATNAKTVEPQHKVTDVIAFNRYPLWYWPENDIVSSSEEIKRKNPELKFGISEYGAGGCIDQHQQNPERPDPRNGRFYPEEYQSYVHENLWPLMRQQPYLWCKIIWLLADHGFAMEARGSRILVNDKGMVTFDRETKKDVFYYYKANWSDEPVIYITSRRHIQRSEQVTDIKIYSNCTNPELTLNNRQYKNPVKASDNVFVWRGIKLDSGANEVRISGKKEGKTYFDSCRWILSTAL